MFESLRVAFRQAVVNFRTELHRDDPDAAADAGPPAMKRELERARDRRDRLRREVSDVLREAEEEGREEATCRRRAELASRIPDEETARLAAAFADRHRRRREILERKGEVLRLELAERERDLEEMRARVAATDPPVRSRSVEAATATDPDGDAPGRSPERDRHPGP